MWLSQSSGKSLCNKKSHKNKHHEQARNVHAVVSSPPSLEEEEYVFSASELKKQPVVNVTINGQKIAVVIDTGASVDIIPRYQASKLKGVTVQKTQKRLMLYGLNVPLKLDGQIMPPQDAKTSLLKPVGWLSLTVRSHC